MKHSALAKKSGIIASIRIITTNLKINLRLTLYYLQLLSSANLACISVIQNLSQFQISSKLVQYLTHTFSLQTRVDNFWNKIKHSRMKPRTCNFIRNRDKHLSSLPLSDLRSCVIYFSFSICYIFFRLQCVSLYYDFFIFFTIFKGSVYESFLP